VSLSLLFYPTEEKGSFLSLHQLFTLGLIAMSVVNDSAPLVKDPDKQIKTGFRNCARCLSAATQNFSLKSTTGKKRHKNVIFIVTCPNIKFDAKFRQAVKRLLVSPSNFVT